MIKKILLFVIFIIVPIFHTFAWDALDDVLGTDSEAWQYQIITNENDVKSLVKWSKGILGSKDKDPFVVRLSKFLLKLSVIIWILVFLIWGIRFLLSMWDDSKAKKVRDNLFIAVLWFVIAFSAWVILQLILSIGPTLNW